MTSAGEVEQYAYCAHNWLLARQGKMGRGDDRGHHEERGRAQQEAEAHRAASRSILNWMFLSLAMAASIAFLALELLYLRQTPHHINFLLAALVAVSASSGMLVLALVENQRSLQKARASGLPLGSVDSDLLGSGAILQDAELNLAGRPDSILETDNGLVPVEVKSGHTPPKPYQSHRLQLACYLQLLDANGHKTAGYGLLNYPAGTFRVDWNDELKDNLQQTLHAINVARETGKADRDHNHKPRCRGCSRRHACTQSLV